MTKKHSRDTDGPHKWSIAKTAEVSRERVKRIFYFRFPEIVFKLNFFDKS